MGDGFEEQHRGSWKPPEQIDVHTEDPLRLSGICRAFTMACICRGSERNCHLYLPTLSHSSFNLLMCVGYSNFLCLECLPGCWLLIYHQTMLTAYDA